MDDALLAFKDIIDAQQQVIKSWEEVFDSAEKTIINLVKNNLELKLRLIKQVNPNVEMPEGIFEQMNIVRQKYQNGNISPLEYFVYIDTMLNQLNAF